MITPDEAYKINIQTRVKRHLEKIETVIIEAAKVDKREAYYPRMPGNNVPNGIKNELNKLGYDVSEGPAPDKTGGMHFVISW